MATLKAKVWTVVLNTCMTNVSGKKAFLTVLVSQEEINRCNNRRMQEALQNACAGIRRVWREQWHNSLSCIWLTHRKVRGFAEVPDQITIIFRCMNWPKHLTRKGLSIKFFSVLPMGMQKFKFGGKFAALWMSSGWRFCLALTVYVKSCAAREGQKPCRYAKRSPREPPEPPRDGAGWRGLPRPWWLWALRMWQLLWLVPSAAAISG